MGRRTRTRTRTRLCTQFSGPVLVYVLKVGSLDYVVPSDRTLDILKIGLKHTQLETHARISLDFLISLLGKKKMRTVILLH